MTSLSKGLFSSGISVKSEVFDANTMEWNDSPIGSSIQLAKSKQLLFVVFIHGEDECEGSRKLLDLLSNSECALAKKFGESCVAIKIKNGSESFKQFSQIYPVLLVPSLYFIDSASGVDLEVTAVNAEVTLDRLMASLDKAVVAKVTRDADASKVATAPQQGASAEVAADESGAQATTAAAVPAAANPAATDTVYAELDFRATEVAAPAGASNAATANDTASAAADAGQKQLALDERVARAKEMLEKSRQKKSQEEKEKAKNSELERRALGKNLHEFKRQQEEEQAKRIAEERRKEKAEEAAARERVRAQIAQDRAEKAARFDALKKEEEEKRQQREAEERQRQAQEAERLAAARRAERRRMNEDFADLMACLFCWVPSL